MTDTFERLKSALADRYSIESEIGTGGMATVYLAEDLKHKRKVAVKVLRPELAAVLGAERFVQEITTTANLQHPHILPLFDSGEADSFLYYVMPFIEGETLRDKLNRETQLGIEEAVSITTDVAGALDYAHRHNVIHRDIKPENILLHEGRPMVADFGIALAVSAAAGGRMTETGFSLGTPHYMSPEQATAEKDLTNRSDIYSLGSVLYEMLTGSPPHVGSSAQQIIMKIVTEEAPPVMSVRKSVPPNVAAVVAKSLEKLPADRFASAKSFAEALADTDYEGPVVHRAGHLASGHQTDWRLWTLAIALVLAIGAAVVGWFRPTLDKSVKRFVIGMPAGEEVLIQNGRIPAISPDGARIAYVGPAESGRQLWVREMDQLNATPIPGTTGGATPIFSLDGQSMAFYRWQAVDATLYVVSLSGGQPLKLADGLGYHGSWGRDGYLYVNTGPPRNALARIPSTGGSVEILLRPDSNRRYWQAHVLPNLRGVLFTDCRGSPRDDCHVRVLDLESGESRPLVTDGTGTRYVEPGFLVYARADGVLLAAPFDQDKLEVTGPSAPMLEGLPFKAGEPDFDISQNGTLVYLTTDQAASQLMWVERDGTVNPVDGDLRAGFTSVTLSPRGDQVAFSTRVGRNEQLWIYDLRPGTASPLTFEGGFNRRPEWAPDGDRILFVSDVTGRAALHTVPADGSGPPELTLRLERPIWEASWSRDGRWLAFRSLSSISRDLEYLEVGADTIPHMYLATDFDEFNPKLSPDGHWLAYVSDESGRAEVYVRAFPTPGRRWSVSTNGGSKPLWAHSGNELFFIGRDDELVRAEVTIGTDFSVGARTALFSVSQFVFEDTHTSYDISPDDRRFLMIERAGGRTADLIVVQNFVEDIKARVGR